MPKIKKIYVWQKQVRPADTYHYYTPTANTIAYYPLRDDIDDYSWNWYNLAHDSWWTATYSNNMVISTDALVYGTAMLPSYWNFTVWCWCYPSSWNGIYENDSGWPLWFLCDISWEYKWNFKYWGAWYRLGSTAEIAWPCHIMVTRSGSTFTIYINWQSNGTFSSSGTMNPRPKGFGINGFSNWVWWVIMESVAWSAQDILDHYNYTKTNYWL